MLSIFQFDVSSNTWLFCSILQRLSICVLLTSTYTPSGKCSAQWQRRNHRECSEPVGQPTNKYNHAPLPSSAFLLNQRWVRCDGWTGETNTATVSKGKRDTEDFSSQKCDSLLKIGSMTLSSDARQVIVLPYLLRHGDNSHVRPWVLNPRMQSRNPFARM